MELFTKRRQSVNCQSGDGYVESEVSNCDRTWVYNSLEALRSHKVSHGRDIRTKVNTSTCKKQLLWMTCHFQHPMQYIAWIKSWGTQSSCLHLLLSDLSLAKLLPTPMDIFLSFNYITLQLHLNKHKALATKLSMTNMNRIILWLQRLYLLKCLEIWFDSLIFFCDWNWKCLRMSERYCGFILITMPGKNRISIAQQTRISIARRCLPKAGTSASWSYVNARGWSTFVNCRSPEVSGPLGAFTMCHVLLSYVSWPSIYFPSMFRAIMPPCGERLASDNTMCRASHCTYESRF